MDIDFTTLVAVDYLHVQELEITWPLWAERKPEILDRPLLIIADGHADWEQRLSFLGHRNMTIKKWTPAAGAFGSQRESMLTSLVRAAEFIETPWYLKIDTDAHATRDGEWIDGKWFDGDPVIVSHRWGYTKPARSLKVLDNWAGMHQELQYNEPPVKDYDPNARIAKHPRIISYVMFGDTQFTRWASRLCPGRLPVPSQDTYLWYCAARSGQRVSRVNMKSAGWRHGKVQP